VNELTDDAIAGDMRVFQRRNGHRYSLDDVVTAFEACKALPCDRPPRRILDLGCGIGSVLLMTAWRFPEAELVGIEAQEVSYALARRNVARNGLDDRITLVHGDLRDPAALENLRGTGFELVTGTPPYMPPGTSTPSTDPQRQYARIEMRGGIEGYLECVARMLAATGRAVVCSDARAADRVRRAATRNELRLLRRRDVVPRAAEGHSVSQRSVTQPRATGERTSDSVGGLFTVWTVAADSDATLPCDDQLEHCPDFVARDAHGARTADSFAVREFFGIHVNRMEAPSP
jgi:tRNA1(Val) A37 N6-methylase TrmN6